MKAVKARGWMVLTRGRKFDGEVTRFKKTAIQLYMIGKSTETWKYYYSNSYRAVRVEIRTIPTKRKGQK